MTRREVVAQVVRQDEVYGRGTAWEQKEFIDKLLLALADEHAAGDVVAAFIAPDGMLWQGRQINVMSDGSWWQNKGGDWERCSGPITQEEDV